jgi:hypothetical protein
VLKQLSGAVGNWRSHVNLVFSAILLFGLVITACITMPAALAMSQPQSSQLAAMENALLGAPHPQEEDEQRLARLENLVFASTFQGDGVEERLNRLDSAIPKAPQQPIQQYQQSSQSASPPQQAAQANPTEAMGYPIVDEMEQQAYGQVFASQPLETRLARLEKRYLGTVQRGDYATRVDNLRWLVLGGSGLGDTTVDLDALTPTNGQPYAPATTSPPYANRPGGLAPGALASTQPGVGSASANGLGQQYNGAVNPYGNMDPAQAADMANAVNRLESDILKANYPNEPISSRLGRLEMAVFNRSAEGEGLTEDQRLQRLMAVAVAEEDAKRLDGGANKGGLKSIWPLIPVILLMLL